jgi:hypothetical protein
MRSARWVDRYKEALALLVKSERRIVSRLDSKDKEASLAQLVEQLTCNQ